MYHDLKSGPYGDGLPLLLDYQSAWNAETAPVAVCEKGRRIGLSWGDAAERVIHAAEGRGNVYYVSYDKDMTEGYISDCADWARKFNHACSEVLEEVELVDEREVKKFRIDFESGKSIVALSSMPRGMRSKGRPGDIVVVDEAAFCDNLEELIKAALAVRNWGGKVRIISTHNGDENPFNDLINDVRAGKRNFALHRITIDDALACGLARRICTVKGDDWKDGYAAQWRAEIFSDYRHSEDSDEELLCIPRQGGGVWLSRVLIESRMIEAPIVRFHGTKEFNAWPEPARRAEMHDWCETELGPLLRKLDPARRHVIGGDFARSGDMSSYAPLEIGETLRRISPFILEMRNTPHQQQVQAVTYVCDRLPKFGGGAFDARGNGSFLAEAMVDTYGSRIEPVMSTEAWYREHMPPFKAAFEDDRIAVPRNEDVLEDLRAFRLVRGVPRLPEGKTDTKGERHGDSGMALALSWYASEHCGGEIGGLAGEPLRSSGFDRRGLADRDLEPDYELGVIPMASSALGGF